MKNPFRSNAGGPASETVYKRLTVLLVRPSKYDDEGYVIRHHRGTQPSNTLSCLYSLTQDAVEQGALDGLDLRVHVYDEIVTHVDPKRLGRKFRRKNTKVLVGLVGVQTNQFPRAQDLARQFKAEGFDVMIGGFHVSGAIAMSDTLPPECKETIDAGVTLVMGEVEEQWVNLLRDAAMDRLQPLYDFLDDKPDLYDKPVPQTFPETQKKFVMTATGTIDAGRGCPFGCSFCTIINVQGRKMRTRGAEHIIDRIRENYNLGGKRKGVRHYFFTDDNFARNPTWEAIFDGLIRLREVEGKPVDFMMQVDTLAANIPDFVEKAARAGCVQVFIGMESLRDDNLYAAGKRQNKTQDYREMIARWHAVGVICHAGYIIGFPHDTYERVMEDVRVLKDELLLDQVSFFMLTPLPGSEDHQTAVRNGVTLDPDYNNYDSYHTTTPHPKMSAEEWTRAFEEAWKTFYSFDQMRKILLRQNPHTYWATIKNFIWYRAGIIERAHPMVTGFVRWKKRKTRRPGLPIESRWSYFKRRVKEHAYLLTEYAKLYFEMQELWLETRIRREEYAFLGDLRKLASQSRQEVKVNWGRVHAVMGERLGAVRDSVESRASLLGATMTERLYAVRGGLGSRASELGGSMGERLDAVRDSLETSVQQTGKNFSARALAVQNAFADLQINYLPPMKRPSRPRRFLRRINIFSMRRIETRKHLTDYWRRTGYSLRRFRFWRLNPFTLTWNLARDTKYTLNFYLFMKAEKY